MLSQQEDFMRFIDIYHAGVDYWSGNQYRLKGYIIEDGRRHPFALICPGGGYNMVSNYNEGEPFAKELNRCGYSAFVLFYRCRNKAKFPAPQEDVARALREIFTRAEEWNLDVTGYSIWGSSAGGHLAASFGTQAIGYAHYGLPKPAALILAYPVITMGKYTHEGSRKNLLGKYPSPELVDLTSVEKQVTKDYPPTFVWWGDADDTVDPKNSLILLEALTSCGVECSYRVYPGVGHGVGLGCEEICSGWFDEAVHFWESRRETGMSGRQESEIWKS